MEFLKSKISFVSQPLPTAPLIRSKTPSKLIVRRSKFRQFTLSPSYTIFSARKFQISARFGRRGTRENYLRKKLTQPQHREVSQLQNPVHDLHKAESNVDDSNEKAAVYDKSNSLGESLDSSMGEGEKHGAENDIFSRKKQFGESIMWNKLEDWVEQYKKDTEFWGIGAGPIFTVFQDFEGKVEKVVVNEDEILRRSGVGEDMDEVKYKISFAQDIAKEMENGSNTIPKHSSVAKFLVSGEKSNFTETIIGKSREVIVKGKSSCTEMINGVALKPALLPRISRFGGWFFCALVVVWAARGIFSVWGDIDEEYTNSEKKMLRRKMKARAEKEKAIEGIVEVLPAQIEPKCVPFNRPQLNKEELMSSIIKAKGLNNDLVKIDESDYQGKNFRDKIVEIRTMAREAREAEKRNRRQDNENVEGSNKAFEELSIDHLSIQNEASVRDNDGAISRGLENVGEAISDEEAEIYKISDDVVPNDSHGLQCEVGEVEQQPPKSSEPSEEEELSSDLSKVSSSGSHESYPKKKLIRSAKEAREFLSRKHKTSEVKRNRVGTNGSVSTVDLIDGLSSSSLSNNLDDFSSLSSHSNDVQRAEQSMDEMEKWSIFPAQISISNQPAAESDNTEIDTVEEQPRNGLSSSVGEASDEVNGVVETEKGFALPSDHNTEDTLTNERLLDLHTTPQSNDVAKNENWVEKNFHELEPVVKRMAVGFRDNYQAAREKASEGLNLASDFRSDSGESELEWMKDEKLREIVFKVRDNELSGRDPFHLMSEEDKSAFFGGLEKKVDRVNENLQKLHEYFHSNIENLDYGADGISIYDPPEKIIPRWKVPPAEKNPEFLNNFTAQRESFIAEGLKNSFLSKNADGKENLDESKNKPFPSSNEKAVKNTKRDSSAPPRTVIEGSDGSVKAGKKNGREFWQHTKKWSQGFLDSYNAETDPEIKAEMRNIGKDLDRWITEKEIQEAAELMEKIPEKGRNLINKKLEKVKREMELFGPQAVVSKYREYSDEKEEDYLWWLDLPHVLCVELYTVEDDGEQKVGFYSLEMAADLELDPKQYHVIAFEDAGDCKHMCYIIQAHMEMLGNGHAFVVARPPKDAFREAKANGFSVTVVRKGQLQLSIDQTLEEVEESIVEIGSKIYHDKITKERGVDINALMKGVFGVGKPLKRRRSKSRPKRRIKP